ncbi:MAG: pyrroline-5-carboxylate reductase [Eubacteriales bacterium]
MNKLFGFIGIGNMGYAMLKGASKYFEARKLTYTDISKKRLDWVKSQINIDYLTSNKKCLESCSIIILAIKPQYYNQVLKNIKDSVKKEHIIISIAPGITIDAIKQELGNDIRIIRAMPNTPALVSEGISTISYSNDEYSDEERESVKKFFSSFGEVAEVEEKLMDSVVPITGSSPAYCFIFIEALADGAVKLGLPRDQAYKMAAQALFGSAKMVLETGEHPAVLKDQVCSPGGTTIEAVATLEKNGFRNAILEAVNDCYKKCKDLSK